MCMKRVESGYKMPVMLLDENGKDVGMGIFNDFYSEYHSIGKDTVERIVGDIRHPDGRDHRKPLDRFRFLDNYKLTE